MAQAARSMSRLALGTVQFGLSYGIANKAGQVSRAEAKKMLQSVAGSIDTLDTAIAYGESEACLGETGELQQFKIVTKLPGIPTDCSDVAAWVKDQVGQSLQRLGVGSVYGLLLHRPDQLLGAQGQILFRAMSELKEAGLVQKTGVSIYAPEELDRLCALYPLDMVQAPFNLVDRRLLTSGWLQRLKQEGTEIHIRSAFLQGLLLMPKANIPEKFMRWGHLWDGWHKWLVAHERLTAVQACLMFPLTFPEVDRVVVGADTLEQLSEIVAATSARVDDALPDLSCDDENLINPGNWSKL